MPQTERVGETSDKEVVSSNNGDFEAPKKSSALDDIFDTNDEADYESSAGRASRLAYLNSLGSKKSAKKSLDQKTSFGAPGGPLSPSSATPIDTSVGWSASAQFKAPSRVAGRTKIEKQEFVKDSVQSKILRETAPSLKPTSTKSIDFDALMQKINDRQKSIKLPTAEQVGLSSIMAAEESDDNDFEELSIEEEDNKKNASSAHPNDTEGEEDEISIEIEEDDESGVPAESPKKKTNDSAAYVHSAPRSKRSVLAEDEEEEENVFVVKTIVSAAPADPKTLSAPKTLFSLDDVDLDDEDIPAATTSAEKKTLSEISEISAPEPQSPVDETSSQTSITETSFKLEYPATLEPEPAIQPHLESTTSPMGVKLKTPNTGTTAKPSLLSTWLANPSPKKTTSAKDSSAASKTAVRAKSTSTVSSTKPKKQIDIDEPLILDENAMTGNDESNGPVNGAGEVPIVRKRLKKTKQLFDDEAEAGYGSDGEKLDIHEKKEESADEAEGGSSEDEYEVDGVHPSDFHKLKKKSGDSADAEGAASDFKFGTKKASLLDDIFETDDRAVIRSVQMQQDLAREKAEAQAIEEMAWRRERKTRRYELALQAEANALMEDRKMEERLAARRSQKKGERERKGATSEISAGFSSLPILPTSGDREWFMDDSDEDSVEGEKKAVRMELERRRVEMLDERQSRRKLLSSSSFLNLDEDSQSILQVIERAQTQHSQSSNPSFPMDENSSSGNAPKGGSLTEITESQDSLGAWFERPSVTSSSFSTSNAEHLTKLKSSYKGHATQVLSSSLLFQRSQDGFENSQDGFKDPKPATLQAPSSAPLSRSQSSFSTSNSKRKK